MCEAVCGCGANLETVGNCKTAISEIQKILQYGGETPGRP
jgi:hypothetical protein